MKKFMTGCGITALIFIVVGFVIGSVAGAIQGPKTIGNILESVTDGKVKMQAGKIADWSLGIVDDWTDLEIEPAQDIEMNLTFDSNYEILNGDVEKQIAGSDISKLNIEAGGCKFFIAESEDENYYVEAQDTGKFQSYVHNGTLNLKVSKTYRLSQNTLKCTVTLYVPANVHLDEVNIELGAGIMTGNNLTADKMKLETGVGSISLEQVNASELKLSAGAGILEIKDMTTDRLNAEVGMGELVASGAINEQADVSCAMGNIELYLDGDREDFSYRLESVMGNITLDGSDYSGLGLEQTHNFNSAASKNINIECNMGNVEVDF